jgi:peptidoglycan/xylan/chitin deacetylase (PgdA/CDA1 family)
MRKLKVTCICWHSVEADSINPAYLNGWNPTASLFREQIRFLLTRHTPMSIQQFMELSEDPSQLRLYEKPPVLLSFDDGFKNVIDQALPILNEFRVPAIFFVIGQIVKNPNFVPWYVECLHMLRKTTKTLITYDNTSVDLKSPAARGRLISCFSARFKTCRSDGEREKSLNSFAEVLAAQRPAAHELDDDLRFVVAEDLTKLGSSSLLTIGSHGLTHRFLDSLTYEEQRQELHESQILLSRASPSYFPALAYPGGAFSPDTVAIARDNYRCAFALDSGSSFRDVHAYPRVIIGQDTTSHIAYAINHWRLTYLLPFKRILQSGRILTSD